MRQVLAALCISGAAACAAEHPHARPAAHLAEPAARVFASTTSAAQAIPRARAVIEVVPALAPPAERACSLSSKQWSGELRVAPGKPVYGFVSNGPTKLSLGSETRDGSAFAEAGNGSLELVGAVDKPDIFTKTPTMLASFVTPLAQTPLGWQPTGEVGRVGVTLDISDAFAVPGVVEKVMPCAKLTIDEPSYDVGSIVAGGTKATAMIGGGVDLFLAPGLPPIARTRDGNYEDAVVLETRGRHTRVAIRAARYYAVGWVASENVGSLGAGSLGALSGTGFGSGMSRTHGCRHDLELVAEVAGARYVVGRLRARSDYMASTLDVFDGFTALTVSASWFRSAPGAKLLVRTQDLAGC